MKKNYYKIRSLEKEKTTPDFAQANSDITTIAKRADLTAATINLNNKSSLIDAVLLERRKELAFEGFRYIDLKRLGGPAFANTGIDRHPAEYALGAWTFPGANPINLPNTSFKFTLPIPIVELNGNGGIQQNPGY
jgi:hypothetical protein